MEEAVTEVFSSKDPIIRARWERIPRKGEKPTLEEFLAYMSGNS